MQRQLHDTTANVIPMPPSTDEPILSHDLPLAAMAAELAPILYSKFCLANEARLQLADWDELTVTQKRRYLRAAVIALRLLEPETVSAAELRGAMYQADQVGGPEWAQRFLPDRMHRFWHARDVVRGFIAHLAGETTPTQDRDAQAAYATLRREKAQAVREAGRS